MVSCRARLRRRPGAAVSWVFQHRDCEWWAILHCGWALWRWCCGACATHCTGVWRPSRPRQACSPWLAARYVPYWPLDWVVNRYVERVIGARRCCSMAAGTTWCRWTTCASSGSARVRLLECNGTHDGFDGLAAVPRHILGFLRAPDEAALCSRRHMAHPALSQLGAYWNATSAKLRNLRLCRRCTPPARRMSTARIPMRRCWSTRSR